MKSLPVPLSMFLDDPSLQKAIEMYEHNHGKIPNDSCSIETLDYIMFYKKFIDKINNVYDFTVPKKTKFMRTRIKNKQILKKRKHSDNLIRKNSDNKKQKMSTDEEIYVILSKLQI